MPDWLQPIQRGKQAPPTPRIARDGRITFERAVERYVENHLSPKTGRPYSRTSKANVRGNLLGGPLRAFRERSGITHADQWSDAAAAEYLRWLQYDMARDSATIKKQRSQLRQFSSFCSESLGIQSTGGEELAHLRISSGPDEHLPQEPALTPGETEVLLRAARSDRDRLAVAMLLYTGMRPSELLALEEEHVRLERDPPVVEVRGSIHRPQEPKTEAGFRDIPLTVGQKMLPKMLRSLLGDGARPRGASHLFLSTRSDPHGRAVPLTLDGLKSMLAALGAETGIKCNPYRFRHTFCTWCADAGMHMLHLQQLLGHASNNVVAYYYRGRTSEAVLQAAARIRF